MEPLRTETKGPPRDGSCVIRRTSSPNINMMAAHFDQQYPHGNVADGKEFQVYVNQFSARNPIRAALKVEQVQIQSITTPS